MDIPLSIIRCEYRKEIDQMLLDGTPYTRISKWLKDRGVGISRNTISKYHKGCFDVDGKAKNIYLEKQIESEEMFEEAVEKQITVIELYDKLIQAGVNTNIDLLDPKGRIDAALKAAKQKQELLDRSGEDYDAEKTELLRAIRDLLINPGIRATLAGVKSRRKFSDPTPN
jgi:nucleotide-binding universal stress UspA family protein